MTSPGPPGRDPWSAAFGEASDPARRSFDDVYYKRGPRHWLRSVRTVLVVLVVLAAIGGGGYLLFGRSTKNSPDAGNQVSGPPIIATSSGSTPSASAGVDTAAAHQLALTQALDEITNWGQLAPFLKNLSSAGVPLTCLNVSASNESACRFGAKSASHHAVLIGDVAALNWLPAIVAGLEPHGWDVQVLTEANCPVSLVAITINNVVNSACATHHQFVGDQIAAIKPALIFASDSEIDLEYATAPPKPKGEPREKPETAFISGLTTAVTNYAKVGKVVVVGSPPGARRITDCIASVPSPKGCVSPLRSTWQDYQTLERNAVSAHATYLDPTTYFCHLGRCPTIVGVVPVYIDGVRVSDAFAKSLGFAFVGFAGG